MRLRSEIWVKSFLRACQTKLINAAVLRHGNDDAGAIYVKINFLDGTAKLFIPAPSVSRDQPSSQTWMAHKQDDIITEREVDDFLHQQVQFDSDLWIIEVEDKDGRHCLDKWL
ncbi:MAG: DUF1491 family protein [Hyphomicrobiaceae bacterium]|nr:DUF1491 family protein [Hyphomicrobiaceae bacterium]